METLDISGVLVEKNLGFKSKDGGSYVRSKESKNFYPSSVSTYTADANSVIRFNITGSPNQWLSLSSLLLGFTLANTDTSANANAELRPISTGSFFSRVRVMMGDVIVCDLNSTSRSDAMKDLLKAKKTDVVLVFGNSFKNNDVRFLTYTQLATNPSSNNVARVIRQVTSDNKRGIAKGKSANVFYDIILKCFKTCENWIPLSYCPITIELYLVNDANLPIIAQGATSDFTATNTSNSWAIKMLIFKGNVYSLDDSLYAEYAKILESGSLPITFETETMQEQTTSASTEIFTTIVRNVSKLNRMFISFSITTITGYVGGFGEILEEYNSLYHPLAHQGSAVDVGYYDPTYDLTASLVIGNQVIPSQEIQGVREAYVHLMHCARQSVIG